MHYVAKKGIRVKQWFSVQCTVRVLVLRLGGPWFDSKFRYKLCLSQHPRQFQIATIN